MAAAVRYRNVAAHYRNRGGTAVRETARSVGSLSVGQGKMVFDVTPVDGVGKGVAATELQREAGGMPVFFGDDATDESADSAARYRVADSAEVGKALRRILEIARRPKSSRGC